MHKAVKTGSLKEVKDLISAGKNVNGWDMRFNTPMDYAVLLKNRDAVVALYRAGARIKKKHLLELCNQDHWDIWRYVADTEGFFISRTYVTEYNTVLCRTIDTNVWFTPDEANRLNDKALKKYASMMSRKMLHFQLTKSGYLFTPRVRDALLAEYNKVSHQPRSA
jgi:hypothetical protein